jgi:DNA invertase Pin-like site-specific DNA recombinase
MFQIIGTMAEFERSLIQESKGGPAERAREGKRLGRPRTSVPVAKGPATARPGTQLVEGFARSRSSQGYAAAGGETE